MRCVPRGLGSIIGFVDVNRRRQDFQARDNIILWRRNVRRKSSRAGPGQHRLLGIAHYSGRVKPPDPGSQTHCGEITLHPTMKRARSGSAYYQLHLTSPCFTLPLQARPLQTLLISSHGLFSARLFIRHASCLRSNCTPVDRMNQQPADSAPSPSPSAAAPSPTATGPGQVWCVQFRIGSGVGPKCNLQCKTC